MQAYYKPQTCTVNWEPQAILLMCELSRSEHTVMRAGLAVRQCHELLNERSLVFALERHRPLRCEVQLSRGRGVCLHFL